MKNIVFFNVSLSNGHLMARPLPLPEFSFIGNLIMEIEKADPEFTWIQIIFKKVDVEMELRSLKSGMHWFKREAERVQTTYVNGKQRTIESKLKRTEWYRKIEHRTKAIDAFAVAPHVLLAINGVWVTASKEAQMPELTTIENCVDENSLDSLRLFRYRDPRILSMLVKRRMVDDLSWYFSRYNSGGRLEPPSFLLTTDDLPYYVHFPAGDFCSTVKSLKFAPPPVISSDSEAGEVVMYEGPQITLKQDQLSGMVFVSLPTLPTLADNPKEQKSAMLKQLATTERRTFELIYEGGKASFILGAESDKEMKGYVKLLTSVYGGVDVAEADSIPGYIREIAKEWYSPTQQQIDGLE